MIIDSYLFLFSLPSLPQLFLTLTHMQRMCKKELAERSWYKRKYKEEKARSRISEVWFSSASTQPSDLGQLIYLWRFCFIID